MRIPFATLAPLVLSLTAWVATAHVLASILRTVEAPSKPVNGSTSSALAILTMPTTSSSAENLEVLAEISTRDLVDELKDRLERRGIGPSKPKTYKCPYCGKKYTSFDAAKNCATKPAILGGCKVAGAVRQ